MVAAEGIKTQTEVLRKRFDELTDVSPVCKAEVCEALDELTSQA